MAAKKQLGEFGKIVVTKCFGGKTLNMGRYITPSISEFNIFLILNWPHSQFTYFQNAKTEKEGLALLRLAMSR